MFTDIEPFTEGGGATHGPFRCGMHFSALQAHASGGGGGGGAAIRVVLVIPAPRNV